MFNSIRIRLVPPMRTACLVSLVTALAACDGRNAVTAPNAPAGSTVSIVSIAPDTGIALQSGQTVKLKVKAAYTLTSDSGTLALVVQDANNAPLAQTTNVVLKGSGTEELEANFMVPDTKSIVVFVPLSAQGQSATATVSSRAFKVVGR